MRFLLTRGLSSLAVTEMTDPAPNYQLEPEETVQQSRLAAKFKESPLFVIGEFIHIVYKLLPL